MLFSHTKKAFSLFILAYKRAFYVFSNNRKIYNIISRV